MMLAFSQVQPFSLGTSEGISCELPSIQASIRIGKQYALLQAHQPSFLLKAAFAIPLVTQALSAVAQASQSLASSPFQMCRDSSSTALISTFLHFASIIDQTSFGPLGDDALQ